MATNFQDVSSKNIKNMARLFALCSDAQAIEDVLWKIHEGWIAEADYRVTVMFKWDNLARIINNLPQSEDRTDANADTNLATQDSISRPA